MAPKRQSLAEIVKEEEHSVESAVPRQAKPLHDVGGSSVSPVSEIRNPKSDFLKLTVTLPPGLFDQLQDLSRVRRHAKQPYTLSHLVREALASWFDANEGADP
jgi:hypothetical protein